MSGLEYIIWYDEHRLRTVVQLRDGERFAEVYLTDEEQETCTDIKATRAEKMYQLANLWTEKHGVNVYAIPPSEPGAMWLFTTYDAVIDGEVVEERREIGASRRAIESG